MTYRNVMRSSSLKSSDSNMQLLMCKDISHMLYNTDIPNIQEISVSNDITSNTVSNDITSNTASIGTTNTLKMIHCINSIAKYQKDIQSYMQTFTTKNIPSNLTWALCLKDPISIPNVLQQTYQEQFKLYIKSKNTDFSKSHIELAFDIYQTTPHYDPAYAHYIASLLDVHNTRLTGEVCDNILRQHKHDMSYSLTSFKEDMEHWKQNGLNHLLLLSAKYMTQYTDWKANPQFQEVLNHIQTNGSLPSHQIPNDSMVAGALEYIAYISGLYNVKYVDDTETVSEFINTCLHKMEDEVPKFLLSFSNVKSKTWGFSTMNLQYKNGVLTLESPAKLSIVDFTAQEKKITNNNNVFFKLGECLLCPEITMLLREPTGIRKTLQLHITSSLSTRSYNNLTENLDSLRRIRTDNLDVQELDKCIHLLYNQLHEITRSTCTKYPEPVSVAAWKISLPTKVLKFNKLPQKYNYTEPHTIHRHNCVDKSSLKSVSGVLISRRNKESIESVIKNALKSNFKNGITVTYEKDMYVNTILHESIACFALHHAALHNIISLNQSIPWVNDHEDKRYAETQVAAKRSGRFRDWCGFVQYNNKNTHVSKLDSHVITVSEIHQTFFPWLQYDNKNKFVQVLSSLPCESLFLPKITNNQDSSELQNLLQSVNNTFKHNTKLFPTRDHIHNVEKDDVHVYTDDKLGSIVFAYSCHNDLEKNVDFMMFKLL